MENVNQLDLLTSYDNSVNRISAFSFRYQCELIISIMRSYCLRVSEVLNLSLSSLFPPDKIIVKISKVNEYFIICNRDLFIQLYSLFSLNSNKSFTVSYKQLYNYIKRNYPKIILRNYKKNNKVTHSFRYIGAKEMYRAFGNEKVIKSLLHHKTISSQKYYLK